MIVLAIGIAGAIAFALLWRALGASRKFSKLAVSAAAVLGAVLLILTATGRLHWLAAIAAGALPFLRMALGVLAGPVLGNLLQRRLFRRWNPGAGFAGAQDAGAQGGRNSSVDTAELRMTLDHETGDMDGEALAGAFAGRRLSSLDAQELKALYASLAEADSRQLLAAYLDQRMPGWAETAERPAAADAMAMNRTQALAVLGLEDGAEEADVVAAHRRLMQKLHPDRGGTDYLAATLNRAKETLLGG